MASEEHARTFREADRRFDELKRQYDAGVITDGEFDERRRLLTVRDHKDVWWAKSKNTGKWRYRDSEGVWRAGTPPYETQRRIEERPPRTGLFVGGGLSVLALVVVLIIAIAAANSGTTTSTSGSGYEETTYDSSDSGDDSSSDDYEYTEEDYEEETTPIDDSSESDLPGSANPEYVKFEDSSGAFSLEAPEDWWWRDITGTCGEADAPGIRVTSAEEDIGIEGSYVDVYASRDCFYSFASTEELLDVWSVEGLETCDYDGRYEYDDGVYVGQQDVYVDCDPYNSVATVTVAVPSDGEEFVAIVVTNSVSESDDEAIDRALDTFLVDGSLLP
jgi:hypothetical protein